MFSRKPLFLAVMASLASGSVWADETTDVIASPVVVTATRVEQNSFDLPVSIDVADQEDIQFGQLQSTLAESLIRVPGITAQNRTNQAQDPQISTRGFGSRSSFGVRGVRVYVDGIPLTMPDGQGQPGVVDLSAVKSVEVMRGPFSALYGNSSGGVVHMLTEDAPKTARVGGTVMFGSYDTKRQILDAAGTAEDIEYLLNVSNLETDGYRDHSAGKKEQATAKFKINFSENTKLTTLVNWFDQEALDPLGLPREAVSGVAATPSAFDDRKAAPIAAYNANTRVSRSHTQIGFNLSHSFNANNAINLITYVGTRDNQQILPTNAAGTNARASEISREFHGTDLRWDNQGKLFDMPYTLSLGATYGRSEDDRTDTNILIAGASANTLNRDEKNISQNFDQYIQGKLSLLENLDIHAGARHTKVKLKIDDNFVTGIGANGDNSGEVEYQKTTPVIGTVWKVTPMLNLFANYGKGFETPTFVEAAFATTAANSVPNLDLKPSESRNFEIGAKAFLTANTQANLTFYHVKTDDEIVIQDNQFGRTTYTNANKTKRDGIELSIDSQLPNNFSVFASYTLLDAKFDSDFTNALGRTIESGNRIPGTYRTQLYGEVAWKYVPLGFQAALEGRHNSEVYVDDINSDTASSYTIFNLRAGFTQKLGAWSLSEFLRVENMFDKEYIGGVRINDNNLRFFEPAAERNYLLGLSANYTF
jgi:iron complex outermembrane receptor protein